MNRQYGGDRFWTTFVEDRKEGFAGLRLHQESSGQSTLSAEVIFWDAAGQFYVQTLNRDVPLVILEALIAETKETIKIK